MKDSRQCLDWLDTIYANICIHMYADILTYSAPIVWFYMTSAPFY